MFRYDVCRFPFLSRGAAKSSSFQRAQEGCIPARYRINPNYRKTYLVVQVGKPLHDMPKRRTGITLPLLSIFPATSKICFLNPPVEG